MFIMSSCLQQFQMQDSLLNGFLIYINRSVIIINTPEGAQKGYRKNDLYRVNKILVLVIH